MVRVVTLPVAEMDDDDPKHPGKLWHNLTERRVWMGDVLAARESDSLQLTAYLAAVLSDRANILFSYLERNGQMRTVDGLLLTPPITAQQKAKKQATLAEPALTLPHPPASLLGVERERKARNSAALERIAAAAAADLLDEDEPMAGEQVEEAEDPGHWTYQCIACGLGGDLMLCESVSTDGRPCPNCLCMPCARLTPDAVPEGEWFCPPCMGLDVPKPPQDVLDLLAEAQIAADAAAKVTSGDGTGAGDGGEAVTVQET